MSHYRPMSHNRRSSSVVLAFGVWDRTQSYSCPPEQPGESGIAPGTLRCLTRTPRTPMLCSRGYRFQWFSLALRPESGDGCQASKRRMA